MHLTFDSDYVARADCRVAMVVANAVRGDSRVIKTAATLSKLGFRVHLFGLSRTNRDETLTGYPFSVELAANPAFGMQAANRWLDAQGRKNVQEFSCRVAEGIAGRMKGRRFDILHTHDMHGLPIGARLKELAFPAGAPWIHDIHEFIEGCTHLADSDRLAMMQQEQEHIRKPDALTTVSPILSKRVAQQYGVPEPALVLNTPRLADFDPWHPRTVREAVGVDSGAPLLVYVGNVRENRGVHYAVEALRHLPEAHLVLLTNSSGPYIAGLRKTARRCGAARRLHVHPYVDPSAVTSFLRGATVGLIPLTRYGNTELCLPTKLFEYLHAGIPVVSTGLDAMTAFLEKNDCGCLFPEGDVQALAQAVRTVLERFPEGLPHAARGSTLAETYCWEAQEEVLASCYAKFMDRIRRSSAMRPSALADPILHLPTSAAGQPRVLAEALRNRGRKATALSLAGTNAFGYGTDVVIPQQPHGLGSLGAYLSDPLIAGCGTCHFHSRPLLFRGDFSYPTGLDLLLLKAMGKSVFFHFRGSEIRQGTIFKASSAYHYVDEQRSWRGWNRPWVFDEGEQKAFRDFACGICDDVLVSDPELQGHVPNALIVPRAIATDSLPTSRPDASRRVPLIVHAPSRQGVKGTKFVQEAVDQLRKEGYAFEFRLVEDMPHREALEVYRDAAILVDQLRIGWYGVLAVEGMAMGKAVVSYIRSDLRHYLPVPAPLAMANPDNLADVLRHLLDHPDEVARLGAAGRAFVRRYHHAPQVAEVLEGLYDRPSRPVDPAAAAVYLAHQSRWPAWRRQRGVTPQGVRFDPGRKMIYHVRLFLCVVRNRGLGEALGKAFARCVAWVRRHG